MIFLLPSLSIVCMVYLTIYFHKQGAYTLALGFGFLTLLVIAAAIHTFTLGP